WGPGRSLGMDPLRAGLGAGPGGDPPEDRLVWNAPLADGPLLRGPGVARNPHAPLPPGGAAGPLAPLDRCGRGFLSGGRRHLRVPLAEPLSWAVRLPRALAYLRDGGERQPRVGRLDPDAGVSRCSLTPFR